MVIVWKKKGYKMTKIADTIAAFFVKSKLITDEEREVSRYGIEILISTIVGLGIIILIGVICGKTEFAFLYILSIVPVRMYTGGYHAKTYFKCNLVFALIFFINLMLAQYFINSGIEWILQILTLWVYIPEILFAPIENANKKIAEEKKKKYKKLSIILTSVLYFVALLLIITFKPGGVIILLALNTVGILMMEVILNEKINTIRFKANC